MFKKNNHSDLHKFTFSKEKKSKLYRVLKFLIIFSILIFIVAIIAIFTILYLAFHDETLPNVEDKKLTSLSETTVIYDSSGEVPLRKIHGDENRNIVKIENVSQNMINAILAAEDDEFFNHDGYDLPALVKSACYLGLSKMKLSSLGGKFCPPRGGSTITQQLAKNMFLKPEKTIKRKLQELVLSVRMEENYTKEEILEMYLNKINFGSNIYGVEMASQAFFAKPSSDLNILESSILAAIPKFPGRYNPYGGNYTFSKLAIAEEEVQKMNLETFKQIDDMEGITWEIGLLGREIELANGEKDFFYGRADGYVLNRMKELGFITEVEYLQSKEGVKDIKFKRKKTDIIAPHFVFWVENEVERIIKDKYGIDGEDYIKSGGLKITTTIDLETQALAEEEVTKQAKINLEKHNINNAALIAIETKTGLVKALVGSADYNNEEIDGEVNIILSKRQPGSTFKPITYLSAFITGKLHPGSVLFDVRFGNNLQNYDGKFRGPVTVRYAIGNSLNIPATKASEIAGHQNVYEFAKRLGLEFFSGIDNFGSSIALGSLETRPIDMVESFATIVNNGKKVDAKVILKVEDRFGNILFSLDEESFQEEVIDPKVAYLMTDILSDADSRGLGWNKNMQLDNRKNIAKTGTATLIHPTKKIPWPADCWIVGGTPQLMTAVWAGNNKRQKDLFTINSGGFTNAGPIWKNFMERYHENLEKEDFIKPDGILSMQLSKLSGKLPPEKFPSSLITNDIVSNDFVPTEEDSSLKKIKIDKVSGLLINEFTPEDAIEDTTVLSMHSYFPDNEKWEKPVQDWINENSYNFLENLGILGTKVLYKEPEGKDNVHNKKNSLNKPIINMIYPKNNDLVSPPRITIELDINAKNDFYKVVFYWDDKIMSASKELKKFYPIRIPNGSVGDHKLKIEVLDRLYYKTTKEILVNIGTDTVSPELSIINPKQDQNIQGGSIFAFHVEANDKMGDVHKVDFYVDDLYLGSIKDYPYKYNWHVDNQDSKKTLKVVAVDIAGNKTTKKVDFNIKSTNISETFGIIEPQNKFNVSCDKKIKVLSGITSKESENFEHLEVWVENKSFRRKKIAEFFAVPISRIFETQYLTDECETKKFYIKVYDKNGKIRISPRSFVYFK